MKITLIPCERHLWEQFKDFHYQNLPLNKSSRCHLAIIEINGVRKVIGFCAMLPQPSGNNPNAYRAHKTVVRLPESPAMFKLWARVSDAQAQHYVAEGKKFYSQAPIRYAAYRDDPDSNWVRTSKDERRKKSGLRSHEYRWVPTSSDKPRQKQGYRSHEFVEVDPTHYFLPEPDPAFTKLARKLRSALAEGALNGPPEEFAARIKQLGGCTITPKNVSDTRCLSMVQHRMRYAAQKVQMLAWAAGNDEIDDETATAALSVIGEYRTAFQDFAKFASEGALWIEKYQTSIVPVEEAQS